MTPALPTIVKRAERDADPGGVLTGFREIGELKPKVGQPERALGRKTYEQQVAGEALRGRE